METVLKDSRTSSNNSGQCTKIDLHAKSWLIQSILLEFSIFTMYFQKVIQNIGSSRKQFL